MYLVRRKYFFQQLLENLEKNIDTRPKQEPEPKEELTQEKYASIITRPQMVNY